MGPSFCDTSNANFSSSTFFVKDQALHRKTFRSVGVSRVFLIGTWTGATSRSWHFGCLFGLCPTMEIILLRLARPPVVPLGRLLVRFNPRLRTISSIQVGSGAACHLNCRRNCNEYLNRFTPALILFETFYRTSDQKKGAYIINRRERAYLKIH